MNPQEAVELALLRFTSGSSCAESVLGAMAKYYGIEDPLIPRISTPFGAGCGRMQLTCGALTGGLMVIGLMQGRDSSDQDKEPAYKLARGLAEYFKTKATSTNCSEIIGIDLNNPGKTAEFRANEGFEKTCNPLVVSVCKWLIEYLPK